MIDKLEKKFGRFAIKNLIYYVLGGYVVGYLLMLLDNNLGLYEYIVLNPAMVMRGQVWRLFTWVLTPPQGFSLWIIFMFLLYFFIGRSLEQYMGSFRYNLYIFSGWFFTTFGAMIVYWVSLAVSGGTSALSMEASTYFINLASFLAFAVIYPDLKLYFFGIIPIKMKWLAWFDVAYLGLEILSCVILIITANSSNINIANILANYGLTRANTVGMAATEIFCIVVSLLNFLIFFLTNRNFKRMSPGEIHRRNAYKKSVQQGQQQNRQYTNRTFTRGAAAGATAGRAAGSLKPDPNGSVMHRCSICGRTNVTNPELQFRYCSKCEGNHEYCSDHIFTHEHIK